MTSVVEQTAAPHLDRDLSWVSFDRRVLELAGDRRRPLAERVKLFAIVASNLDDFFATRVSRLRHRTGEVAERSLALVREAVLELQEEQDRLWHDDLQPSLEAAGVRVVTGDDAWQRTGAAEAYRSTIEPMIQTIRLGRSGLLPQLESGRIAVAAASRDGARCGLGVALVPRGARFVYLGGDWLYVDDGIARNAASLLPGRPIDAAAAFRVIRGAEADEPLGDGSARDAEQRLQARRFGPVVRLEVGAGVADWLADVLARRLALTPDQVYRSTAPVGLADLRHLVGAVADDPAYRDWSPSVPPAFAAASTHELLDRIRRRNRLVHHPYESFEHTVQRFTAAAHDEAVTELAATVYRTSRPSGTLAALIDTAHERKRAVCLVELRARFDERQNIEWSRTLEDAGVHVLHGPSAHKVHAKLMAITRAEEDGPRSYVHIGTGNYHASNAFGYEDLSLFSADPDLAADVAQVFACLESGERPEPFRKLLVGPWYLRDALMHEIATATEAARAGVKARIRLKVNSLGDRAIVDALYEASRAGVDVDIVVRGICTLVPEVPGTSDRITVRSVLGRFLEHSRIFSLEWGDTRRMWIGSADLLPRNLDHRIETLVPIEDRILQRRLTRILDTLLADTRDAWQLDRAGEWSRVQPADGVPGVSAQELFIAGAQRGSIAKR